MIRRLMDWLLRNYDCCEECDRYLFGPEPTTDWVQRKEEGGGNVTLWTPPVVKGERPRYPGDGAVM